MEDTVPSETSRLHTINLLLAAGCVIVGLYLAISPVIPIITFAIKAKRTPVSAPYGGRLANILAPQNDTPPSDTPAAAAPPTSNQLVIPSIFFNETILEGDTIATADRGAWRRPASSTPDAGGNTVIVGHRWTYRAARDIFFHLDKVKVGDSLAVYWQQNEYIYKVTSIQVVEPHEIWVEEQTDIPSLTLYTCTPVWSSKHRLVIRAELQSA